MGTVYKHWSHYPAAQWRWPNFTPKELACKGTGELMIDEAAMDKLQALRTRIGRPMVVNSAYRSAAHNRNVGGAKSSQHLLARAFDVRMTGHVPADFQAAAKAVGFTGFGHYPKQNFMHIDIASPRRWNDGSWFPEA